MNEMETLDPQTILDDGPVTSVTTDVMSFSEMMTSRKTMTNAVEATTAEAPCYLWTRPPCDPVIAGTVRFQEAFLNLTLAVGIPGCILTIIILARMRPFNSYSVWLMAMAAMDFGALFWRLVTSIHMGALNNQWEMDEFCRFWYIAVRGCRNASFLCLAALTIERFLAVWFPSKMAKLCTIKRSAIVFLCMVVTVTALDFHQIETRRVNSKHHCIIRAKYRYLWQDVYQDIILRTLFELIPMVLLITLNILIIVRLRRSRRVAIEMNETKVSDEKEKAREHEQAQIFGKEDSITTVNRMLIAATVVFFLTLTPSIVYEYTKNIWGYPGDYYRERARYVTARVCASLLISNHALNFVFYILASTKFRREIILLLTCKRYKGFRQPNDGSSTKCTNTTDASSGSGSERA